VKDAEQIFPIRDGRFVPVDLPETPLCRRIAEAILELYLPPGYSVYLRGSCVERVDPHPHADIDLVVIGSAFPSVLRDEFQEALVGEGRPVEVSYLSLEGLERDQVHRVLLSTRARLIAGPARSISPVEVSDQIIWSFWNRYSVFMIRLIENEHPCQRLCKLKQLTRGFGVAIWFFKGEFSRDIATCLEFARDWAPEAANLLHQEWAEIDTTNGSLTRSQEMDPILFPFAGLLRHSHSIGRHGS